MATKECSTFPKAPAITGTSPSDCLISYSSNSFGRGSYPSAEMQSVYFTSPADWASFLSPDNGSLERKRLDVDFLWITSCFSVFLYIIGFFSIIYLYIYIYIYIYIYVCVCIYIYICVCVCVCVCANFSGACNLKWRWLLVENPFLSEFALRPIPFAPRYVIGI